MTSLKRWRKPMETSWKKNKSGCYSEGHVFFLKASVGCFFSSRNQIVPTLNSEMLWQSMHQITLKFIEFTAKSATFPDNEDTIWRLTAGLCLLFCNKFDRLCCNESRCLGIEGFCDNTPSLAEWKEFSWTNFLVPSYIGQHPQVQESSFWFWSAHRKTQQLPKNPHQPSPKKKPGKTRRVHQGVVGDDVQQNPPGWRHGFHWGTGTSFHDFACSGILAGCRSSSRGAGGLFEATPKGFRNSWVEKDFPEAGHFSNPIFWMVGGGDDGSPKLFL